MSGFGHDFHRASSRSLLVNRMGIKWQLSRSSSAGAQGTRRWVLWVILIFAAAIAVIGAIGLWAEMGMAFRGNSTTGRVIEHHHAEGSGRMASIVAQVEVAAPAGGRVLRAEVEDQFAVMEWTDGGTVNLICVGLATAYPHCQPDSMLDRWLTPAGFLVVGLGVVWWVSWWRQLMRTRLSEVGR